MDSTLILLAARSDADSVPNHRLSVAGVERSSTSELRKDGIESPG